MNPNYRITFSLKPSTRARTPADVKTIDLRAELDQVPSLLPAGVYIMYIEDLHVRENVHWTRWPKSYRPGFGGDQPSAPAIAESLMVPVR
jgi:hypothetical protein